VSTIAAATLVHIMKQAVADGLNDAAKLVQEDARELAPKDTEELVESIKIDEATPRQATPTARVYTGARHAVPQHERLDYAHPNGGQAKYLEAAALQGRSKVEAAIAARVRQAFG